MDIDLLPRLHTAVGAAELALAHRLGVSANEIRAIGFIVYSREPATIRSLRTRLGLSAAAVTELVDRMVTAGHLVRSRSEVDHRMVLVQLTDGTRVTLEEQIAPLLHALDALGDALDASARSIVESYLTAAIKTYTTYADATSLATVAEFPSR